MFIISCEKVKIPVSQNRKLSLEEIEELVYIHVVNM